MHRREFLRGVSGSVALASVGVAASVGVGAGAETTTAHPGPYRPLGRVSITNAKEGVPGPDGEFAYVAKMDGFAVVDVRIPSDLEVVAERTELEEGRETGPLRMVQDVKVEGDRLVAAGPANPVRGDVLQGVALFDVSDPKNPEQLAFHETRFPIHNCFLRDNIVYLTGNMGDTNALVIVDASDDSLEEVGRWSPADRNAAWNEVPTSLWTVHDVWVENGRAYLSHWDAGTYLVDVSDPASPAFVSRIGGRSPKQLRDLPEEARQVLRLPGNDHYAMASDDGNLMGINKEAWRFEGEGRPGGIELWDVSDATNPTRLSTIAPPKSPGAYAGTWTTSHNFDIVGDRLFSSWYQGGVKIHDISDPANPEQLAWWRQPDEASFWTAKRATDGVFVASSMGRRSNGKGGLYTFPIEDTDRPQKDPPSLTTEAAGTTSERAALAGGTTTRGSGSGSGSESESDGGGSGEVPGFGVGAALAALVGASAWRRVRE